MNTKRVTLWHDLLGDKYIVSLSDPNRTLKKLADRPYAYKIKSSKAEITPETEETLRENFDELVLIPSAE